MFIKRIQIGLIHAAVAITLVPINSTLNRIMIEDMGMSATLFVVLFSFPYLFSFIQMGIGSFSDRHPIFGYRRTPYILLGLFLCIAGLLMATQVALLITENFWVGIGLGLLTFSAWGMGFNFATVSYFALASELSGENGRSKTTAVMFVVMIVCIILTALALSRMLDPFSADRLQQAFSIVALAALVMGVVGVIKLEPRQKEINRVAERYPLTMIVREVFSQPQVALFFLYLILMLAAILGQDVLLEPFAASAFGLSVGQTTRITSIWGVFFLVSLVATGFLEGKVAKIKIARLASGVAICAFLLILVSGFAASLGLFYAGVMLLGLATGPATVSNLSLMLDMTIPGKVGLFIGAWGAASALARLAGSLTTAIIRDLARSQPELAVYAYGLAFFTQILFLAASLLILRRIDVTKFKKDAAQAEYTLSLVERAALGTEG